MIRQTFCAALAALLLSVESSASHAEEAATEQKPAEDSRHYIVLRGGGELVGMPVKETPDQLFVDIGPEIVGIPLGSIVSNDPMVEALQRATQVVGATGSGVFDPDTGSVIFNAQSDSQDLLSQTQIVDRAKESVVLITNPRGAGSGFLLDEEGRIVTNHHVINREQYHTVNVFTKDGERWERVVFRDVPVLAYSPLYDIALLQLDMEDVKEEGLELKPLPVAASGTLEVGDAVFAIGNPGVGRQLLEHSVSEGIASSLARNINDVLYIQTTAAVNPGNSGGPIINRNGEVVGLVTLGAIFQEGIAFALPVDLIYHFLRNSESFEFSSKAENRGFRYLDPQ